MATIKQFQNNGYLIKKKFLKSKRFYSICNNLNNDIEKKFSKKNLNKLGGFIAGNLNVNPGPFGKPILKLLLKNGLAKILKEISGKNINNFTMSVGGNLTIPNKYAQYFHMDGDYQDLFYFVSVATSNVYKADGPTEIVLGGHKKELPYWKFLIKKKKIKKLILSRGDLIIRRSNLWHRGTVNYSNKNRYIIAYLFFEKKDKNNPGKITDNYFPKKIKITNNFFGNNISQKIFEYFYIYFGFLFVTWRFFCSFFIKIKRKNYL